MPISFRSLVSIVGALMFLGGAIQAQENCNAWKHHRCTGPFFLTVRPRGTPAAAGGGNAVDVCRTCDTPGTNPYATCPGHSCSSTVNADGSTTVEFDPGPNCTDTNTTDHFGVVGTNPGPFDIDSAGYSCGAPASSTHNLGTGTTTVCPAPLSTTSAKTAASKSPASKARKNTGNSDSGRLVLAAQQPDPLDTNTNIVSVTTSLPSGPNPVYFVAFVRGTQTAPPNFQWDGSGVWIELPYVADPSGQDPVFNFENHTDNDIWLNDVGYSFVNAEIRIDLLNYINYPPPGTPGTQFTAVPCMDGMVLHPGDITPIQLVCPTPTPATTQIRKPEPNGLQSSSGLPQTPLK